MGTISLERKIFIRYDQEIVEHWKEQPQVIKDFCDTVGKAKGYSGQNVFLNLCIYYWTKELSGMEYPSFFPKRKYKIQI